ncbi:type II toxin-antitoxin system VapC family toxin [Moorella sulfitireducens]|uniref:type II toxin-antitoxin system VapC family toxin n=1 Tax=Neomoorella sulfitireducens TaxID=2972948 RepID=UPI0021ABD616|nr:PIN domain-containing protein [Moorella sulfitireducens]
MILEVEAGGALVDTDFLIDLNRGKGSKWRQKAEKLLYDINYENLFVSNITVTEFITGIPRDKREEVQNMLRQLYYYIAPTYDEAFLAGTLRQEWRSKGYSISIADVTNAAIAISRKLVLVTRNTKHYPFEQLLIKSW